MSLNGKAALVVIIPGIVGTLGALPGTAIVAAGQGADSDNPGAMVIIGSLLALAGGFAAAFYTARAIIR